MSALGAVARGWCGVGRRRLGCVRSTIRGGDGRGVAKRAERLPSFSYTIEIRNTKAYPQKFGHAECGTRDGESCDSVAFVLRFATVYECSGDDTDGFVSFAVHRVTISHDHAEWIIEPCGVVSRMGSSARLD